MGARNESRATGAIAQMKAEGVLDAGKGQVEWLNLDLSTVTSSRAAGEMFMQQEKRLDILSKSRLSALDKFVRLT